METMHKYCRVSALKPVAGIFKVGLAQAVFMQVNKFMLN